MLERWPTLTPQPGRSTLSSGRSPGLRRLSIIACCSEPLQTIGQLDRWPVELRAGLVGAAVGMLAWFAPDLVGGGDAITQRALPGRRRSPCCRSFSCSGSGSAPYPMRPGRLGACLPPCSYWAPNSDCSSGSSASSVFPGLNIQPEGFAVVGMAAFFTGVVRAPLTGIVLVVEMTANVTMLLPMLGACFMAMLAPTLMRDPPIDDSLRERTLERERTRLKQRNE